jgi:hypothetical protein
MISAHQIFMYSLLIFFVADNTASKLKYGYINVIVLNYRLKLNKEKDAFNIGQTFFFLLFLGGGCYPFIGKDYIPTSTE